MDNIVEFGVKRAHKIIEAGLRFFSNGELPEALDCFKQSIEIEETPEGYTYWGWALSFMGQLDEAIQLCMKAIKMDPDFGNPYNDIGTYHMKKGELATAIPWLEKAKLAKRYEPRHFPYLNLGRIHLRRGRWWDALREFEGAVRAAPNDPEARKALHTLRGRLN